MNVTRYASSAIRNERALIRQTTHASSDLSERDCRKDNGVYQIEFFHWLNRFILNYILMKSFLFNVKLSSNSSWCLQATSENESPDPTTSLYNLCRHLIPRLSHPTILFQYQTISRLPMQLFPPTIKKLIPSLLIWL